MERLTGRRCTVRSWGARDTFEEQAICELGRPCCRKYMGPRNRTQKPAYKWKVAGQKHGRVWMSEAPRLSQIGNDIQVKR